MEDRSVRNQDALNEERKAREVLIENNLGLVRHVAKRFAGRGTELEDLIQIGTIGLIKAADRFDRDLGLAFSTHAVPWIMGEIRQFLRDDGPVKIARSIRENAAALKRIRDREYAKHGREPGLLELAREAGMRREDVILALEATGAVLSLEGTAVGADGEMTPLADRITEYGGGRVGLAEGKIGPLDPEKERLIDHITLKQLWGCLEPEEKRLLFYRFYRDASQAETAKILGVSQVQVSRREQKILKKLREMIKS